MLNRTQIINDITRMVTLRELVEAYEEIAATRMRRIRSSVLQTRDFLEGLAKIFQEVKLSYKKQILALMKQKKIKDTKKLSLVKRNGKTVCILLSSNTGLYGDIVRRTYFMFNNYHKKNPNMDLVIIGRLGKLFFEEDNKNSTFEYFDFPDNGVNKELLAKLTQYVVSYEKILVFYGKFQNIVYQNPVMFDMYGAETPSSKLQTPNSENVAYFFEPSLEEILVFFEGQMFGSIFEQTVHESDLAKFAARMFTLDKATENIRSGLKKAEFEKRVIEHRLINKKQLGAISGFKMWKKR